jgi:ACS family glucarate transporter-like MFS transporter
VFTIVGGIGVVFGLLWLIVIYAPRNHPRLSQAELDYIRDGGALVDMDAERTAPAEAKGTKQLHYVKALLKNRMMLGVYFGQYFINTITWFFLTWFPVYLVQERHMSILKAGFIASLPAICGFVGGILGGVLSDGLMRHGWSQTKARKLPIVVGLLLATVIIGCNYVDASWLVVLLMAVSFFGKGLGALGWAVVADTAPKEIAGLSGGVFNTFGSLAAITTPIVIGYLVKTHGSFELALLYVGLSALAALLCYLVVVGPIKRLDITDLER